MRDRLVDAAVAVITAEGAEAATTRRILQEAGLSAGALYHYFGSKSELLSAVAVRMAEATAVNTPPPCADAETIVEDHIKTLRQVFDPGGELSPSELSHLRDLAHNHDNISDALRDFDKGIVARFGPAVKQAQQLGIYQEAVDADALVELVQLFFEAFTARERSTGFATSREEVLGTFVSLLNGGLLDAASPHARQFEDLTREIVR